MADVILNQMILEIERLSQIDLRSKPPAAELFHHHASNTCVILLLVVRLDELKPAFLEPQKVLLSICQNCRRPTHAGPRSNKGMAHRRAYTRFQTRDATAAPTL